MACASDISNLHIFFLDLLSLPLYFSRFAASPDQPHVFSSPPLSSSELLPFASSPDKMHVLLFFSLFRCFPPFFSSQESVNMRNCKFYSEVIFLNLKFVRRYNDNKIRVHLDLSGCVCGLFFYPTLAIFSERENSNSSNIKHKT